MFIVFFVTLRQKSRTYLVSTKKETCFFVLCSTFVTLEEIAGFLYIKAVWGIEEKAGYDLEAVLNSTFCYKLLSMSTRR